MSILLEALRKSEKNQQPREVPTIHAEDQSGSISESFSVGPLALLLVAALFTSGWFVWQQYRPPTDMYQPPVTLPAGQARAPVVTPVVEAQGETASEPSIPIVDNSASQQRTPVESYQQSIRNLSKSEPGKSQTSGNNRQETPAADGGGLPSSREVTGHEPASTPTVPSAVVPARPVATDRKEYRAQQPAPIGYWELPDAVRSEVPEIKFSVLVYAQNPADRFVLISGVRLSEGDSVQPGLVVEEIRREGVVFSYRLYQFLIER